MSLIEIKWRPSHKELRNFGIIALIASTIISLLLYVFKGLAIHWTLCIFAAGLIILLSSFFYPKLTKIIYLSLTLITVPIGFAVSFILLAAFYFLLLTPLGLLFRLIGRDPLNRKFNLDMKSYWLTYQSHSNPERYFRQF
jgi:ABC-type uncharacterized transport system permease subunit